MANLQDTPRPLARIQADMITDIDQLSELLEAGEIDINTWERRMGEILAQGTGRAYRAGKEGRKISQPEATSLARFVNEQLAFLSNFADEIKAEGWQPAYKSRAQMYATATRTPYSMGDVVKQAGKPLPLPSMPAEGTICHTNCKCEWFIETVNAKRGDYNAYWKLGTNDNCQTCIQRAQDWNPVKIREGVLL